MTPRDRRALIVGGCVILTALVALRLAPWGVRARRTASLQHREEAAMLAQARDLVAATPVLRDSLADALQAFVDLAPEVVGGATQAEGSAGLASAVNLLATRSALKVVQLNPAPDSAPGIFRPVIVRGEFEGDITGLSAFLAAVEGGRPLLTIRTLSVVAPDPVPHAGAPEALRVEAEIAGWYLSRVRP